MTRIELAFVALSVTTAALLAVGLSSLHRPQHVQYRPCPITPPTRPQTRTLTASDFEGLVGMSQHEVIGRVGSPGRVSRWDLGWEWEYRLADEKTAAVRFRNGLGSVESVECGR